MSTSVVVLANMHTVLTFSMFGGTVEPDVVMFVLKSGSVSKKLAEHVRRDSGKLMTKSGVGRE